MDYNGFVFHKHLIILDCLGINFINFSAKNSGLYSISMDYNGFFVSKKKIDYNGNIIDFVV